MAEENLTRGQRAARTRAANRAKKAQEAEAPKTLDTKVVEQIKDEAQVKKTPTRVKKTAPKRATRHAFTFVHKGENVTVTHEGTSWTVSTS